MKFFQNSVLQKHLKNQDAEAIKAAYHKFTAYFHNPEIQQNIRDAKEEQFQEGFLRELFVNVLGYILNPNPNYNLTSELKNEKGAKKADGAILAPTMEHAPSYAREHAPLHKVLAVIELKGTDTKDLDKINVQAFNYKNNQTGCIYVVTSNFEKLRFFIHHSVDHLEFNLFTLTEDEFQLLWLCLSAGNLFAGVPLKVKEDSLLEEEKVTKQLYKDYSAFRTDLWQNMVKNSPEADRLLLFKKTQKLLDRYLFILFAEDSGLLPPNSVSRIIKRWEMLKDEDAYKPLYIIFNQYFGYINTGRKGKNPEGDIFAYNGGLFLPDEVLDHVVIDDEILHPHVTKLTKYDFQSEIDVNILGHIFENSLNEIENITAQLEGQEIDKSKSKRKKDGVFYTPKYITKYIVENTIGKLCDEKKTEFEIIDEEYAKGRRNRKKETIKKLADNLQAYRNWLLQITICDPACGSGAFLNQALEFLMTEHAYIDELQAQLFGASIVFQDISNHILEQNIYGVDINEESVDIAKLSLWLRTAQRGRKLTTLNNNIKCGNSLIDDPAVAGDKAFNWQNEFPAVFQKKVKRAWHVTCATHNSRYSQRMFDNYVKLGEPVWLSAKEEIIVTETIAEIVAKDGLNVLAYNICGDHMHLLLVCEDEELPRIVQKIKSMSARATNIAMGRTREQAPSADSTVSLPGPGTREHAPSSSIAESSLPEYSIGETAMEWVNDDGGEPGSMLPGYRGTTQAHLWTQKFGRNPITSDEQLWNTIAYIRNNRAKHGLPEGVCSPAESSTPAGGVGNNKGASSLVNTQPTYEALLGKICCSVEHAFRNEYKGGFDVVIGNPPYVPAEYISDQDKSYLEKMYTSAFGRINLYPVFYERGILILKAKGILSLITPYTILKNQYYREARRFILENTSIDTLIDFKGTIVFEDAAVDSIILTLRKEIKFQNQFLQISNVKSFQTQQFDSSIFFQDIILENNDLSFTVSLYDKLITKISNNCLQVKNVINFNQGIITGGNDKFITKEKGELTKEIITGSDFNRYLLAKSNNYIIYDTEKLHRPRKKTIFEVNEKILLRQTSAYPICMIDTHGYYTLDTVHNGLLINGDYNSKFLLALLNSKLIRFLYESSINEAGKVFAQVKIIYIDPLPIKITDSEVQKAFIKIVDLMLSLNKELQEASQKFQRTVLRKFTRELAPLSDLPAKLQNWYKLSYAEFIAELGKKKVKLSLSEEAEWEDYFVQESKKALELKTAIDTTDREIDRMVYTLYDLSDEEIQIVEQA